ARRRRATLFPYTTLFRSIVNKSVLRVAVAVKQRRNCTAPCLWTGEADVCRVGIIRCGECRVRAIDRTIRGEDVGTRRWSALGGGTCPANTRVTFYVKNFFRRLARRHIQC